MAQLTPPMTLQQRLDAIAQIIRDAENRAIVETPDDDVPPPTFDNVGQDAMQRIYDLARGETW